ncbi:MAG: CHASE domain-containing protein [Thiovulaceae bacterium]|nr:CHASE domain-containing protein [Sulfurimonadaceae bacterium]
MLKSRKNPKRFSKIIPFILIIIFGMITYQYYKIVKNNEYNELQTEFSLKAQEFQTLLQERMLAYEHVLYGTKGLFIASESVERNEFKSYITTLSIDQYFPGIQGIGYAAVVPADHKEEFINKVRVEGFSSYNITPVTPRDFYTTILYLEPFDARNQRAFGYDMFSNPERRIAMEQSRDGDTPIISGKVTLRQEYENNVQAGFLMYLPLFQQGTDNDTVNERRKHILGWIYAPFRMNDFMHGLNGHEDKDFDLEIYDSGVIDKSHLMYDSDTQSYNPIYSKQINMNIAGRDWTIFIKSTPNFEKKLELSKATLILVFGMLFSFLLVYLIWKLLNENVTAEAKAKRMNRELLDNRNQLHLLNTTLEKRVKEKTQELQHSNEILEKHVGSLNVLNTQLTKAKEEALQAAQARSNFISSISHELRTPLNAIINFTDQTIEDFDDMLKDKELQNDTKVFLQRVIVNSRHLLQLINDLLEFTKVEAGKMDYKIEEVDINETLQMAYNNTYSLLNGTEVKFNLELHKTPLIALVDSRRLLQVILNLLSNAIKFTQKGKIELRSYIKDGLIMIEVEDTGKGIPVNKQKMVFEPFMQVDNTDNGTGLGLGLAKRMCDDMGIKILLISIDGSGTIFRLMLKK